MCAQAQLALYNLLREVPRSVMVFSFILAGDADSGVILENARVWLEEDDGKTGLKKIFVNDLVMDTATKEVGERGGRQRMLNVLRRAGVRWVTRAQ